MERNDCALDEPPGARCVRVQRSACTTCCNINRTFCVHVCRSRYSSFSDRSMAAMEKIIMEEAMAPYVLSMANLTKILEGPTGQHAALK